MNPFGKPPRFKKALMPGMSTPPVTNTDPSKNTLHELNEQIGRRRTSLYANPGEKAVDENKKPSYFTGIKRVLRTRYGGSGQ